jgi:hypothetical protein
MIQERTFILRIRERHIAEIEWALLGRKMNQKLWNSFLTMSSLVWELWLCSLPDDATFGLKVHKHFCFHLDGIRGARNYVWMTASGPNVSIFIQIVPGGLKNSPAVSTWLVSSAQIEFGWASGWTRIGVTF